LEAILDTIGMIVIGPAATIAGAEQLLLQATPDVAVVDINLHGEMAYGLVAKLHDLEVPVIIVSGYEVHPSMHNTSTTILTKPIRAEALLTHLRRVVAERQQA
jgi:DNA-binding NtrC family response regulator